MRVFQVFLKIFLNYFFLFSYLINQHNYTAKRKKVEKSFGAFLLFLTTSYFASKSHNNTSKLEILYKMTPFLEQKKMAHVLQRILIEAMRKTSTLKTLQMNLTFDKKV